MRRCLGMVFSCLAVVACGGGGDDGFAGPQGADACGVAAQKQHVLDTARNFYLFPELLPASVDPAQFPTAGAMLDALTATARDQQKDRFFSHVTSITAEQQFFAEGESVGFGFGLKVSADNTQLFVTQVFKGSAAEAASFVRGDEIRQIGTSESTLVDVATLLAQPNGLSDALGPSQGGVTRVFRVRLEDASEQIRTATKRAFGLDPVPDFRTIVRTPLPPVGYLNLRTFISPADNRLREAFTQFRADGVRNLIIDLRYNGGGLVSTAEILGALLAQQAASQNAVMHRTEFNARRASISVNFRQEVQAVEPLKLVFLTTDSSASASELVINALSPYADSAIVGTRSFGKPVGQEAFDLSGCDFRLRLVSFKSVNMRGFGDYFTGLHPDSGYEDAFCDAADDLADPQGDVAEEMTATALGWIDSPGGACPPAPSPKRGTALATAGALALAPLPRHPSIAQIHVPGLF